MASRLNRRLALQLRRNLQRVRFMARGDSTSIWRHASSRRRKVTHLARARTPYSAFVAHAGAQESTGTCESDGERVSACCGKALSCRSLSEPEQDNSRYLQESSLRIHTRNHPEHRAIHATPCERFARRRLFMDKKEETGAGLKRPT